MLDLKQSAEKAVRDCLGLKPGEKFVLIYDEAAVKVAASIKNAAEAITNGNSVHFCMEDYGQRTKDRPLRFPAEIKKALESADVSFLLRGKKVKGEMESFTRPLIDTVNSNPRLRHAHAPGVNEDVFLSGMAIDYNSLKKITARVNSIVKYAREIKVTTPAGSDFTAKFSPKYHWVISDGFITPTRWGNLPTGETYTCPRSLDGKIVVDGVLGDFFDQKYGVLERNPLRIRARNSRIIKMECPGNLELEKEFLKYIKRDKNANRFGEFAIGTNIGLEKLLGNMLHDEKFPGVHIAVGHPYPKETGAKWDSKVHCDMVMKQCNIYVDGQQIMSYGKFNPDLISNL